MFRKHPELGSSVCPQCAGPMIDMGRYFEPPSASNARLWDRLKKLADTGFRFSSTSKRNFIFGPFSGSRAPSVRTVAARIDSLLERTSAASPLSQFKPAESFRRRR
jgi:hypothetical protein